MRPWFALFFSGPVVRRGLQYAVIVGAILVAINHGSALLRGDVDTSRWIKIALTVVVPYLVSSFSSVAAILEYAPSASAAPSSGPGPTL